MVSGMNSEKIKNNRKRRHHVSLDTRHVPLFLMIPAIVFAVAMRYGPSGIGVAFSFTDWTGLTWDPNFVGFGNYIKIFTDPFAQTAVKNTLMISFLLVVFSNVIGLLLALVLQKKFKLRNLYRALFFLPFAVSYLATGYIWQYILTFEGPFNQALGLIGLENMKRAWLFDPDTAIYTIIVVMVWQYVGLTMVIYLAGLEGIPDELNDATAVDGAKRWIKFRKVTLPLLTPAIAVATLLTMVWSLASFDQIISLTNGGPAGATETMATQVYKSSFRHGVFGYGAAFATVLAMMIACFALLQRYLTRKMEERI